MTEEENTRQVHADRLRADFLNATTNWQRWQVLNRALEWAVTASELAELQGTRAKGLKRVLDDLREKNTQTVTFSVDASSAMENVRETVDRLARGGSVV